jgi:ATP-binding cassette subfamily B protein
MVGPFGIGPARFLWHYVKARARLSLLGCVVITGAAFAAVAAQYGMKLLIDALSVTPRTGAPVWQATVLFLILLGIENTLWRLGGWLGSRAIVTIGVDIRLDLFRQLLGHASGYFSEHQGGALANRITATAGAASSVLAALIWNVLPPVADLAGSIVVLDSIDWRIAFGLLLAATAIATVLACFGARGRAVHSGYYERAAMVGGEIVDVLANNWIVRAFSGRQHEMRRLGRNLRLEAMAHRRSWMFVERLRVLHDVLMWLVAAGVLVLALNRWAAGALTTGDVVLIATTSLRLLHGSRELALAIIGVGQNLGAVRDALRVIGTPHQITDRYDAKTLEPVKGAVRFDRVNFRFPERDAVFDNLTIDIPAGQSVGIVGPSGAGKSTLIRLVQRLEEATGGQILIDGHLINRISLASLQAAIAVVPQEISLFNRTIAKNIRYGRPTATDDEVVIAAIGARCHDFISALPEGYRTRVGERGVKLSGGQRQRIGIARALLKNAPIIIFDEATSALDSESEIEIQQAVAELAGGRTVLAVAHRLSSVASFDRILFLKDGRIVEDGSPAELWRRNDQFARMWRLQTNDSVPVIWATGDPRQPSGLSLPSNPETSLNS